MTMLSISTTWRRYAMTIDVVEIMKSPYPMHTGNSEMTNRSNICINNLSLLRYMHTM